MGLPVEALESLLDAVPDALVPKTGTLELLHRLREAGLVLYVLSNMHTHTIERLDRRDSIWGLFSGRIISCRVHCIKPEPEIYSHLLERYDLAPEETVFFDDMRINLDAAKRFGLATIEFRDPEGCARDLTALGCLPEAASGG